MLNSSDLAQRRARLTPEQLHRLAQRIAAAGAAVPHQSAIPSRNRLEPALLSYAQQRHWFLWQLEPLSTAYHLSGGLRLTGKLDLEALRSSFEALVARHESLRTVFHANAEGLPEQVVEVEGKVGIPMLDFSGLPVEQRVGRAHEEAGRICATPFDLTQGPLLRLALIRIGPEEHLLVVVMHHIISDAWSNHIVVHELVAQYRARIQGQEPSLPALPIQYADYAMWQRNWLEAGEKERQLAYWRSQLGEEHPVLQLPVDHPRPSVASYSAARHCFLLPDGLVARLQRQAQSQGATLFMALLAGFQALLHRYTGQEDIRVGVPIANRHRVEIENIVGFFVNTQVLRNRVDARIPLKAILDQAREAALGAQTHQDLPFEQLVEALQPERNLNQNPLFQVMYNHMREDRRALEQLPGLTVENHELAERAAQFELTLDTVEQPDGQLEATFTYAAELFEPETIRRLGGHYLHLLQQLADYPERILADIDILSEGERGQLAAWGVNEQRYGNAEPVHCLIERQVKARPDAVALIFGDTELSYAELNLRANRLAHRLIGLGVKPETRVGIAVERSIDMIVGLLAILKSGGAYVPLDPEYPRERLVHMVEDSSIGLLLTQSHVRQRIPQPKGCNVLELDRIDVTNESESNPEVGLHGHNLAYVIYTSGSTGKPKGVGNRHVSLYNRLTWMQQAHELRLDDVVLQKTPFSFDVSVWEFFWPLMNSARLVIAAPGDHRDAGRLLALIQRHSVTTLHFVPSMLLAFLPQPGIEACTSLRRIICSGEALLPDMQQKVFDILPWTRLYNLYGPTEAAIDVTQWLCVNDGRINVPIGQPISDTRILILDADLNLVPLGVAGELYLGGIGLARGYLNRGGLTAERFIADPFHEGGGRLYRTGDLARWRSDGQVEYLGRLDHQVKIRGFRIELGEIETQLLAQPEVREAVVVVRTGTEAVGGSSLMAYVSSHAGADVDIARLRQALAKALPDYMIPSAIVLLESLPLNPNGKLDRKALPEPEVVNTDNYEAPQGEVEEALARAWRDVLGIAQVGRHDNFFELGGHSLAILQVQQKLQQALSVSLPLRLYFENPLLKDIAAAVHERRLFSGQNGEYAELSGMAELLDLLEN
jgi:amino acid adenylation domain-containing protein